MTFGELLGRWLAVKNLAVEPTTLSSYEWVARTYLRPALGDRKVASLRPIELDGLYADLSWRGLSPRTVRICHTVIGQALEQAGQLDLGCSLGPAHRPLDVALAAIAGRG